MDLFIYTCSPEADADLAGTPARVDQFEEGKIVLAFNEGSRLEVTENDLMFVNELPA